MFEGIEVFGPEAEETREVGLLFVVDILVIKLAIRPGGRRIVDVEVGRKVWVWSAHRPSNTTIVAVLALAYVESGPVQEKGGLNYTLRSSSSTTTEMQKVACRDRDHAARELDWI